MARPLLTLKLEYDLNWSWCISSCWKVIAKPLIKQSKTTRVEGERAGGELQISHQLAFVLSKTFAIYHFRIEER